MDHGDAVARTLAAAVRRRREELRLPVDLSGFGGPAEMTVRRIESGEANTVRPKTKVKLERALRWRDGVVDKVLNGTVTEDELSHQVVRVQAGAAVGVGRATGSMATMSTPLGGLAARAGGQRVPIGQAVESSEAYSVRQRASVLQDATRLIDQLTREPVTPAINEAVDALLRALPDIGARDRRVLVSRQSSEFSEVAFAVQEALRLVGQSELEGSALEAKLRPIREATQVALAPLQDALRDAMAPVYAAAKQATAGIDREALQALQTAVAVELRRRDESEVSRHGD